MRLAEARVKITVMTSHAEARDLARAALTERWGAATTGEVKALAGIGKLESSYGDGWKGTGRGSNNIGAIQGGKGWGGGRFRYVDTHPNADGTSTPYQVDFRAYATPRDGWADLQRVAYEICNRKIVRAAAKDSDWYGVSAALYLTRYYEGWGKTKEARIANHHRSLSRAIAAADGATTPDIRVLELPPTVRFGDRDCIRHGAVWQLQTELQIAADGAFGPVTRDALLEYQRVKSLTQNAVCDARTWDALLHDEFIPEAA